MGSVRVELEAARGSGRIAIPQLVLQDLSRRVPRDRIDQLELFRNLLEHEFFRTQEVLHLLESDRVEPEAKPTHP